MTHSEAYRRRFDEIEKKKLDKQFEEEAAKIHEPPSETVHGMDVEQAQEQPLTGGASSSSGPNKRARNLAGMLLFDENDTSDWQETVWEAQLTEVL